MGRDELKPTLGWTLEIAKNAHNGEYFPVYKEKFWAGVYPIT